MLARLFRKPEMTAEHNGRTAGPTQSPDLKRWVWILAALILLASAGVYAFCVGFSKFAPYDDEGTLMITVRGYLEGHRLYDDVLTYYGPCYYFYEWFLHGLLSLPLTTDVTKMICVCQWLVASTILAWAGKRLSGSTLLGLFIFTQGVLHLAVLVWEPGHPQEIVVLLLLLAVLAAERGRQLWVLAILGAITATLALTKINVGVFFGCGLMLTLCSQSSLFHKRKTLFCILLVLGSLSPLVLMRPHLAESWAVVYSGNACATLLASGAVAYALGGGGRIGFAPTLQVGTAFAALSTLVLAVVMATGSTVPSLLESLVTGPAKLGTAFCAPLIVPHSAWSGAAAVLAAVAIVAFRGRSKHLHFVFLAAKGAYGFLGTLWLAGNTHSQLGYLWPWCWLLLLPTDGHRPMESRHAFARTFLCIESAFQGLQAYPVAGTQVGIATLLPVLLYSLCLYDAIIALACSGWAIRVRQILTLRTALLLQALVLTGLFYLLAGHWCKPLTTLCFYASLPPLGLRGATLLHLPKDKAEDYRDLTGYLKAECDAFITIPGMNSLYFWTDKSPPTYFIIAEVVLLSEAQQAEVVAALQKSRRSLIVLTKIRSPSVKGPLGQLIATSTEIKTIGRFRILQPSFAPPKK